MALRRKSLGRPNKCSMTLRLRGGIKERSGFSVACWCVAECWARGPGLFDLPANSCTVAALVAVQEVGGRHPVEQTVGGSAVGDLTAGQQEGERTPTWIVQGMGFGGSSATGPSDGLGTLPPLPPLAERLARTAWSRSSPGPVGHPPPRHGRCLPTRPWTPSGRSGCRASYEGRRPVEHPSSARPISEHRRSC